MILYCMICYYIIIVFFIIIVADVTVRAALVAFLFLSGRMAVVL